MAKLLIDQEAMNGRNLLFIGGGIGLAPLRSLIWNCLDCRQDFGAIRILYGARSVGDLILMKDTFAPPGE